MARVRGVMAASIRAASMTYVSGSMSTKTGVAQFGKLERNTVRRRAIAAAYDDGFADLPVSLPTTPDGRAHVFHQYTIDVGPDRDTIVEELAAAGVSTGIYYPIPVNRQPYVLERGISADLPVTDLAAARTLSLPMHPGLTGAEQDQVIAAVDASIRGRMPAREEAAAR